MNEFLFVYGTLLPGFVPAHMREIASRLRPVSTGSMPGRLYDLGQFPGAVFDANADTSVHGEVFQFAPERQLCKRLDAYEGFDRDFPGASLFLREKHPISLPDGTHLPCWVYLYNRDPGNSVLIASGNYSQWVRQRPK
jgi:gamma-glutamylcyclotransferase (GGCT)/AIG2-like uncharacterized protein YtfP